MKFPVPKFNKILTSSFCAMTTNVNRKQIEKPITGLLPGAHPENASGYMFVTVCVCIYEYERGMSICEHVGEYVVLI